MPVGSNLHKWGIGALGMYITFLLAMKGTALYNLASAVLLLCTAVLLYRTKTSICIPAKFLTIPYLVFACGLTLSSVLQGEANNIVKVLHYIYITLPLFLMYAGGRCFVRHDVIYKAMAVAAGITAAVCISSCLDPHAWLDGRFSPESHPNVTVQLLLLPVPFVMVALYKLRASKLWTAVNIVSLLVILMAAFLTRSRGGLGGFLVGLLILGTLSWPVLKSGWSYKKTAVVSLLLAVFMTLISLFVALNVFARTGSDQGRLYLLYTSVRMFEDHPLCGIGFDNWSREYPRYIHPESNEPHLTHAHNDVLNLMATTGALGAGGYVFFSVMTWLYLVKRLTAQPREAMLWAMLWMFLSLQIHGFVDISVQYNQSARMFFGMLGLTLAIADKEREIV